MISTSWWYIGIALIMLVVMNSISIQLREDLNDEGSVCDKL